MDDEAKQAIEQLREDIFWRPDASLICVAKRVRSLAETAGIECPDFVNIMANGNTESWKAVIEMAQADLNWEAGHANA